MIMDPLIWFSERELDFIPKHFVKCRGILTDTSRKWVYNKSQGRFAFSDMDKSGLNVIISNQYVYFEDQKDAMMFELLWADSK